MLTRRQLLKSALAAAAGPLLGALRAPAALGMGDASRFRLALLRHTGDWNARPNAAHSVLSEVDLRTSVRVSFQPEVTAPDQERLFRFPFLWVMGARALNPFPQKAVENLRRHLRFGGTLVADDISGRANSPFSESLRRELERIFPAQRLAPLPSGHAVYRSYYFLRRPVGRAEVSSELEGITVDDRAAVIFSPNDLSGALERDGAGGWRYELDSSRQEDRSLALRLAVNLVVYALTVNYKLDQVHTAYQLRHPSRYPEAWTPTP